MPAISDPWGRRRAGRWPSVLAVALFVALLWVAPQPDARPDSGPDPGPAAGPAAESPGRPPTVAPPVPSTPTAASSVSSSAPLLSGPFAAALNPQLVADQRAGVLSEAMPAAGTGTFGTVAGTSPPPGSGPVRTVRVEVEGGLPVDPSAFAVFVLATLNDPRGWGHGGGATFARTDGPAEITVVLASPQTTDLLCRPLVTAGLVSCRSGDRAVITYLRWATGAPDYGTDRTGYRQYVINHEVGHVFGRVHEPCPGPGLPAPVMQQQTLGLSGCVPNPWPYP